MFVMCTSTNGLRIIFSASSTGIDLKENPAGLIVIARFFSKASWIQPTITHS